MRREGDPPSLNQLDACILPAHAPATRRCDMTLSGGCCACCAIFCLRRCCSVERDWWMNWGCRAGVLLCNGGYHARVYMHAHAQVYTVVEDRPLEKERRTLLRETHRVEKRYVVETRFLGERELPGDTKARMLQPLARSSLLQGTGTCELPMARSSMAALRLPHAAWTLVLQRIWGLPLMYLDAATQYRGPL